MAVTDNLKIILFSQVEVIKQAYQQEDIEVDEDDEIGGDDEEEPISPREVGHNIYILAHQVRKEILKNCVTVLCTIIYIVKRKDDIFVE